MHDVFISYSSKDKQVADAIVHSLEAKKLRCWIAPRDITPGQSYPEAITTAIDNCQIFVLVFSENSNSSRQVESEMTLALSAEKTILPFKLDNTQPSKAFRYIFGASHWLDALSVDLQNSIEVLARSLVKLLERLAPPKVEVEVKVRNESLQESSDPLKVRLVTYQELLRLGYDSIKISERLEANDHENYPGITAEQEGECEQWAEFLDDYPESFRFLINEQNEIVGAWYMLAATEAQYQKVLSGSWNEQDFQLDNTAYLAFEGIYKGFILDMSINKRYRSLDNTRLLIDSFFSQLETYATNGIFFSDFVVNVFSRSALAMYRSMGFTKVCDHQTFGEIYHISLLPLGELPLLARYPRFKALYEGVGKSS